MEFPSLLTRIQEALDSELAPAIQRTQQALQADAEGKDFETVDIEGVVHAVLAQVAPAVMAEAVARVDGGRTGNQHRCRCGGTLRFVGKRLRWFGFLFGAIGLTRAYFHCQQCKSGRIPLEQVWGLQEGFYAMGKRFLSPRAQRVLVTLCTALPYPEAQACFVLLTGLQVSAMMGWRLVQKLGRQLRAQEEAGESGVPLAAAARPGKGRGKLRWLVSADGIFVGFWNETTRRARKGAAAAADTARKKKKIVWQEVRVGVVALLDAKGKVARGSQWYVARLVNAASFRPQLRRVAVARGVRKIDVVAVVTDGAGWLLALWLRHFGWAVGIRDFYHACEHLTALAAALHGEGSQKAARWAKQMRRRLKRGEMSTLLTEWDAMQQKPVDAKAWEREKNHFRKHPEIMAYDQFRKEKLPIGSGSVEGGCKNVVGSRFKRSGARWSKEGFHNLIPLRARYCSGAPIMPEPQKC